MMQDTFTTDREGLGAATTRPSLLASESSPSKAVNPWLLNDTLFNPIEPKALSTINQQALDTVKWIALLLMTGDHVNKYLFNGTLPWLFEAGRLALPLFMFVLMQRLCAPGAVIRGVHERVLVRLVGFGVVAAVPYTLLSGQHDLLPLNVLFSLAALTAVVHQLEQKNLPSLISAAITFGLSGFMVEYGWLGLGLGLSFWAFFKRPSSFTAVSAVLACSALSGINGNFWALGALPICALVLSPWVGDMTTLSKAPTPRHLGRWFFYAFYPAHLLALLVIRIPMAKAGYLFF